MSSTRSLQRRQADGHDVQAIEQILAEQALADGGPQVTMGRGNDADIGAHRLAAADGGELAFLQHAQEAGLGLLRHIPDLIEEQRAAGSPARNGPGCGWWRP